MKRLSFLTFLLPLALVLLNGCSVRFVPLDSPTEEEKAVYEMEEGLYSGYYPGGDDGYRPESSYHAWWMSQYYQRPPDDYVSTYGQLPPDRLNIDPNPNDSYAPDESPVRQVAPSQRSVQPASHQEADASLYHTSYQRAANRSRSAQANLSGNHEKDHSDARAQLKSQRHPSEAADKPDEDDREAQRRKTQQRTAR